MPEPTYRHVKTRMDQGILVLTLNIPELHGDQMADELRTLKLHDDRRRTMKLAR